MVQKRKADLPEEKSRALLLDAAKKLFAKQGFDGTTVRDIAQEAGVNLSLVSYYFEGKEGLYRSCLEQFGKARLAMVQRLLAPVDSVSELRLRFRMAVEEIVSVQIQNPELSQMIHREIDCNLPIAQKTFEETFLRVFQAWVDFFRHASEKGLIRPGIDPLSLAQVVQGALNNLVRVDPVRQRFYNLTVKNPVHREHLLDNLVNIILSGCLETRP